MLCNLRWHWMTHVLHSIIWITDLRANTWHGNQMQTLWRTWVPYIHYDTLHSHRMHKTIGAYNRCRGHPSLLKSKQMYHMDTSYCLVFLKRSHLCVHWIEYFWFPLEWHTHTHTHTCKPYKQMQAIYMKAKRIACRCCIHTCSYQEHACHTYRTAACRVPAEMLW